jgi:hypothetical protein
MIDSRTYGEEEKLIQSFVAKPERKIWTQKEN